MGNICVFGASSGNIPQSYKEAACEVGALIAENGWGMVFGGGAVGLMGAAAEGAYAGGGRIIGVLPERLNRPGIASELCSELIVVRDMHERKATMEKLSYGYIALPGGFGTIEELLEVLTLKQLGYIDAPIIILNVNGFFGPLLVQLDACVSGGFTNKRYLRLFSVANTPLKAIELARQYVSVEMPDKLEEALRSNEKDT